MKHRRTVDSRSFLSFQIVPGDIMTTELTTSPGTVGEKKDVLARDIKTVAADADVLLRRIAGAAADSYSATRTRVEGKLGDAKTGFGETRTRIAARARDLADTGQAYAKDNPWKVLGAAAIIGLAIGVLLKRR
jgi:ElaB/YqjD/DUF883 family membrane-anchored ribosome-binding protein